MSAPVDVLAVLDAQQVAAFERGDTDAAKSIGAGRVALAELAEAARALCDKIGFRIDDPRCALRDRLVVALARVGGAA